MSWSDWLSLALICALGALSPGPSLAVVVRSTLGGGRTAGIAAALAHAVGIGVYAFAVALGLAIVVTGSPTFYTILQLAGSAFLAWLGWRSLSGAGGTMAASDIAGPERSLAGAARDGFLIAFLNPKIAIWFLALFSQFVAVDSALGTRLGMAALAALIDGAWYVLVAVTLSIGSVLGGLRRRAVWIDRIFGLVLIIVALRVAATVAFGAGQQPVGP